MLSFWESRQGRKVWRRKGGMCGGDLTHPVISASRRIDHPLRLRRKEGFSKIYLHASLRGGTTWQSPICRATLYFRDCHAALNDAWRKEFSKPLRRRSAPAHRCWEE
ncbi:MAG: hypothetical protein JWR38_2399 [Mucilaginibacter sp.]|nr:hypothetical protein [Mucilaginibacter sp.]